MATYFSAVIARIWNAHDVAVKLCNTEIKNDIAIEPWPHKSTKKRGMLRAPVRKSDAARLNRRRLEGDLNFFLDKNRAKTIPFVTTMRNAKGKSFATDRVQSGCGIS